MFHLEACISENYLTTKPKTGIIGQFDIHQYSGGHDGVIAKLHDIYKDKATFFAYDKLFTLSWGLPSESIEGINYAARVIISCETKCEYPELPSYFKVHLQRWYKELGRDKTPFEKKLPEVLYFQHGLRFASQKIKDYYANRDVFDVGAYIGDSAYVLAKYNPHKIYSYEIGKQLFETTKENVKKLHIDNVTVVINKGISDKVGEISIDDEKSFGLSMNKDGKTKVPITTIDEERKHFNAKVGFIKADVEGFALNVLEGAKQTIAEDRPILQISIYHTFYEFFYVNEFIRQFPNYIIDYHTENEWPGNFLECSLFAYPAEIEYPIYPQE